MNLKALNDRLTALESRQPQGESVPEWWADVPADLKADVGRMDEIVKAAGGLSASPAVLKTANRLAVFISAWHDRRGAGYVS